MGKTWILLAAGAALSCLGAQEARADGMALPEAVLIAGVSALHYSTAQALSDASGTPMGASTDYDLPAQDLLHARRSRAQAAALVKPGQPPASGKSILETVPRVGAFDLTFYSDVPAGGYDAMFTAFVVVSLTRRF